MEGERQGSPAGSRRSQCAGEGRTKAVSDGAGVREEGASSGLRGGKQAGSGEVWVSLSREKVGPNSGHGLISLAGECLWHFHSLARVCEIRVHCEISLAC